MAKRLLVKVNEADNVAIAVKEIKVGTQVSEDLVTRQDIPQAHKVALERIPKGQGDSLRCYSGVCSGRY